MNVVNSLHPVEILLVEDREEDAELTRRALRRHRLTNHLHHARDGAEALEYLFGGDDRNGHTPRVILLDLKLPKVSGLEVLRALRANARTRHIPVVVLSSSREDHDLVEAYTLGANSYIVKPVEFEAFVEAVSALGFYWALLNEPPVRTPSAE